MEQTAATKWETKRKIGKSKYVLLYGVIGFGIGLTVALTLMEWIITKRINAAWVFIRILIFPMIGSLIGNVRWTNQENKYDHYLQLLKRQ